METLNTVRNFSVLFRGQYIPSEAYNTKIHVSDLPYLSHVRSLSEDSHTTFGTPDLFRSESITIRVFLEQYLKFCKHD
ncbi:hypothetical protein TNCT_728561 [Trichonephila clavata]|uniref:Uncharacterized protein n=1 Tax=Trichonephila clavata TaxID=2740835 RepID=A0A8X6G2A2_TRICU|nr:hypothetical protein TNCT_728561 [Trichonephila clavata]